MYDEGQLDPYYSYYVGASTHRLPTLISHFSHEICLYSVFCLSPERTITHMLLLNREIFACKTIIGLSSRVPLIFDSVKDTCIIAGALFSRLVLWYLLIKLNGLLFYSTQSGTFRADTDVPLRSTLLLPLKWLVCIDVSFPFNMCGFAL